MKRIPLQSREAWKTFRRFFSNPKVGIAGSVASIVGLGLAIYFFAESQRNRELLYVVNPAQAVIVKAGQLSRLSVSLDGKQIDSDVTAAQIAFWNQGKESIRREHVLSPLTLRTDPSAPIIDATIRKTSRNVVRIDLDKSRIQQGELGVSWNILERGDGALVQIIFARGAGTDVTATAVIEGQRTIRRLGPAAQESSKYRYAGNNRRIRILTWVYIGFAVVMAAFGYWRIATRRRHGRPIDAFGWIVYVGGPVAVIAMAGAMAVFLLQPEPPFGF